VDITLEFHMVNDTGTEASWSLSLADELGWAVDIPAMVQCPAGDGVSVVATVSVPPDSVAETSNRITFSAVGSRAAAEPLSRSVTLTVLPTLLVNEVCPSGEWVELLNPGPTPVGLEGWRLAIGSSGLDVAIRAGQHGGATALLPGGECAVVHFNGVDAPETPGLDLVLDLPTGRFGPYIDPAGDTVSLTSPAGLPCDWVAFGASVASLPAWFPPNAPTADGNSIGRAPGESDTDCGHDWANTGGRKAFSTSPGVPNNPGFSTLLSRRGWTLMGVPTGRTATWEGLFDTVRGTEMPIGWRWDGLSYRRHPPAQALPVGGAVWTCWSGKRDRIVWRSGSPLAATEQQRLETGWHVRAIGEKTTLAQVLAAWHGATVADAAAWLWSTASQSFVRMQAGETLLEPGCTLWTFAAPPPVVE
jgi:hypothetical protein